jgi:uncharacterized protein
MAFEVQKINPLDLQPRKAIGVQLPFSGRAVFNPTYQSRDAIKTNLINYFLTIRGERYLDPTFGTNLQALLFDQLTEDKVRQIDTLIRNEIRINFPRVEPVNISTIGDTNTGIVQFSMSYTVRDTNIEDEVVINFAQ